MNTQNLKDVFVEYGCLPHQMEFAAKFFAEDSPRKHLLSSLPGLGKGFIASAIVGYVRTHGLARRILILVPAALTDQWREMMRCVSDLSCEVVDRRRLRELEAADEDSIWKETSIVIMSIDFARRDDVADLLMQLNCDMLVVDEAHHLRPQTQRYSLVSGLLEHSPDARVLFLQVLAPITERDVSSSPLFRGVAETIWSRQTVRDKDGQPLLPEVHIEWVFHRRRDDEVQVLSQLQAVLRSYVSESRSQLEATTLLQTASSSLFALEQRLNRMRQRRNEIAHGLVDLLPEFDEIDLPSSDPLRHWEGQSLAQSSFADQISGLLELLDEVNTDSKFESLLKLFAEIGLGSNDDRRVCIFTSYVDTAAYLEAALSEHYSSVFLITGRLPFVEREQALTHFAEFGGILVSTSGMALPLPEVAAVIFYDLPLNPAILDARIGQFIRVTRCAPIRVFAFTDAADALMVERIQRKVAEIKQALGEGEVQQILFPDGEP